jgi:hypothetical protein
MDESTVVGKAEVHISGLAALRVLEDIVMVNCPFLCMMLPVSVVRLADASGICCEVG